MLLLWVCGLTAYGSLYPFDFSMPASSASAWSSLFAQRSLWTSRSDVLGNLLLFMPYGVCAVLVLPERSRRQWRFAALFAAGVAFALLLQVAQIYVPARSAALADVLWNAVGIAGGMLAARGRLAWLLPRAVPVPLALIVLWLVAQSFPLVPAIDWQGIKDAVRPLVEAPRPQLAPTLFIAAGVVAVGLMADSLWGRRAPLGLAAALIGLVALKPFIVTQRLDSSILLGYAAGFAVWLAVRRLAPQRAAGSSLLMLVGAYTLAALSPFTLAPTPTEFHWLPFTGMLKGSMLSNARALMETLFAFAAAAWLVHRSGGLIFGTSIALALWVWLLEYAQTWIGGRTGDVTEVIIVLACGYVMQRVLVGAAAPVAPDSGRRDDRAKDGGSGGSVGSGAVRRERLQAAQNPASHHAGASSRTSPVTEHATKSDTPISRLRPFAGLAVTMAVMAVGLYVLLRLPGVPYNVRELFRDGGPIVILIFAAAVLWIGAGAAWVADTLSRSRRPWVALPAATSAAALISLLLLSLSVTDESLDDIAGSNNVFWFVTNRDIWGAWARELFLFLNTPALIRFFERPVRYAALYIPPLTFIALAFAVALWLRRDEFSFSRAAVLIACSAPLLWLCKAIAFDWSSTDNLNELVARDGPWGWGGGGYLYLLLALAALNITLTTFAERGRARIGIALVATLVAVPLSWLLLNQGLEQHVNKYDLVFSGAQFLLGPDRKHVLSEGALFFRWTLVYLCGVVVVTVGARAVLGFLAQRRGASGGAGSR